MSYYERWMKNHLWQMDLMNSAMKMAVFLSRFKKGQ